MERCVHYQICRLDEEEPGSGLCILHSKNPAKDMATFQLVLRKHRESSSDFSRIVFPDYFEIPSVFDKPASFNYCNFLGEANFSYAIFSGGAYFVNTVFHDEAFFDSAQFQKMGYFVKTQFQKMVSFVATIFNEASYFRQVTFMEGPDFSDAKFSKGLSFKSFKFKGRPDFSGADLQRSDFYMAEFENGANFSNAKFSEEADFRGALFKAETDFVRASFSKEADFKVATFLAEANFNGAKFQKGGNFQQTGFKGRTVDFNLSSFSGKTSFTCREEKDRNIPIFSGTDLDFSQVIIDPPDVLTFIGGDLKKCKFVDTDLRKIQFSAIIWPRIGRYFPRFGIYDEIVLNQKGDGRLWGMIKRVLHKEAKISVTCSRIERLYRELKQNYEDRRDYAWAGDFHYGEKEMLRRNPESPLGLRFLLTLYSLFSGYGERWVRPLIWLAVLTAASTYGYSQFGLLTRLNTLLCFNGISEWLDATLYSFQVILFLKPAAFEPAGIISKIIYTIQHILGPLLIGLLALAVRQKLKR